MSKRFLKSAQYSVHQLVKKAPRLSFQTRYDYEGGLKLAMTQLHELGYQLSNIRHLKTKHVQALLARWQSEGLNAGTVKNRLSQIRFVANLIHKPDLLPPGNDALAVEKRIYQPQRNRALYDIDISKIQDPNIRYSVMLQKLFGLRREESIKFIPSAADHGTEIVLKGSWTKGGIERSIPVVTDEQRAFIEHLRVTWPTGRSLIPAEKNYIEQRYTYVAAIAQAGYKNLHGLRHAYAQTRYRQLTEQLNHGQGWDCPKKGGLKKLTAEQKKIDQDARQIISIELGHSRPSISRVYV